MGSFQRLHGSLGTLDPFASDYNLHISATAHCGQPELCELWQGVVVDFRVASLAGCNPLAPRVSWENFFAARELAKGVRSVREWELKRLGRLRRSLTQRRQKSWGPSVWDPGDTRP